MELKERIFAFRGMLYGLIAGFCSSASGAFVKLTHNIHSIEILIFRDIVQASVCLIVCIIKGYSLKGEKSERKFMLLRCIFGTISLTCWFVSVKKTNFGDAAAIYYSYPVFIVFLARIFLKEPFDLIDLIIVISAVVGIFFISGPHYITAIMNPGSYELSKDDILGVSLASVACVAISCGNCAIRKLSKTPAPVVVVWFSLFSMTCAIILVPIVDKYVLPENPIEWLYILLVGVFGVLTQIFVTLAFQLEHAAPISLMESFNVVFSFLVQYFVFNEPVGWTSIVGAVVLFSAVFAIGLKRFLTKKSPEASDDEEGTMNIHNPLNNNSVASVSTHQQQLPPPPSSFQVLPESAVNTMKSNNVFSGSIGGDVQVNSSTSNYSKYSIASAPPINMMSNNNRLECDEDKMKEGEKVKEAKKISEKEHEEKEKVK